MPESKNWDQLPAEVLDNIFCQVQSKLQWKEARYTLYQSQLVSKVWCRSALCELYKNVYLSHKQISSFANALKTEPRLGRLVKSIEFYPECATQKDTAVVHRVSRKKAQRLSEILKHIPNIERLSAVTSFEKKYLWRQLLASKKQYKRLKVFASSDKWGISDKDSYTRLALMSKGSLTKLRLLPSHPLYDISKDTDFHKLKNRLKEFKSIEQLQLCGTHIGALLTTEIDEIVNDCHQKMHSLDFENCDFSENSYYIGEMVVPNNSIKKLKLGNSRLSVSSVRYFTKKLKALETLALTTKISNSAELQTEEQYAEWWKQMTDLCRPLQNYNIRIDEFSTQDYLHQIRGCANLLGTLADSGTLQGESAMEIDSTTTTTMTTSTEFTMINPEPMKARYIIEMKQNGSCVRLFKSENSEFFTRNMNLDQVFECIQPFSPNIIRILQVESLLYDDGLFQNYAIYLESAEGLGSPIIQECCVRNWAIFHGVISLIENKAGSVVHLDKTIFLGSSVISQQDTEKIEQTWTSISELKFTNSLFHPNVLSEMSLKLSNIDTLILDGCTIMSNFFNEFEIRLPATTLGHLELKLHRQLHLGSLFYPVGCQTFIVITETAETAYYYIKGRDSRTYQQTVATGGYVNDFVTYIRCKELQSLTVSGIKLF